ncbi:unnamed protein product, partial [Mesorhabditis belari]|uniref:non-specific serine/threonine protein kinase n=1 Tax=Mesorhabditis belari TaxID=2138241 RepID=A0AAF3FC96_9BILA
MQVNEVVSFEENAESIGHGGYGRVFLLRNHTPQAVIKLIDCDEAASAEILRREYETLEKLSHPNVVSYIGLREVQNDLGRKTGILMEYCPRGALRKILLDPRYIYSMNTVFCWIEQLFDAVDYLKRNDTIHRDIKPENIFVTEDFALKLGDFGSNKISEMTCAGTFVGTFRYMSPPQSEEMARSSTMEV